MPKAGRSEGGREGGGGGGKERCNLKIVIAKGGTIFICNYLGGEGVWYTTLFPAPLWDVINDRP